MPASLRNNPISPMLQLLIFLRHLDSGGFQNLVGESVVVAQSTVSGIIWRVAESIIRHFGHVIAMPGPAESQEIQREFRNLSQQRLRGVVGLIDGTLVKIQAPSNEPRAPYICRHGFTAINVQGVVNHNRMFRNVVARFPGSCHDALVLRNSSIWRDFENGTRQGIILGKVLAFVDF